eukprot:2458428-Rhodomonas_salina.1
MGHHFQVLPKDKEDRDATRPPRKCPCVKNRTNAKDCRCGEYYDCVVAQTNVTNGTVNHGPHREIVVYDPDLVYPEFMLVLGPTSAASSTAQASAALSTLRQPASAATSVRGNVKAIVSEMKKNKNSAAAQEKGCKASKVLAGVEGNRATVAAEEGIEAVITGMQKH